MLIVQVFGGCLKWYVINGFFDKLIYCFFFGIGKEIYISGLVVGIDGVFDLGQFYFSWDLVNDVFMQVFFQLQIIVWEFCFFDGNDCQYGVYCFGGVVLQVVVGDVVDIYFYQVVGMSCFKQIKLFCIELVIGVVGFLGLVIIGRRDSNFFVVVYLFIFVLVVDIVQGLSFQQGVEGDGGILVGMRVG